MGKTQKKSQEVARDRKTQMLFAHVVPRKGMISQHGADAMVKNIEKLRYKEIILKSDVEPAIRAVQEEVRRRRTENAIPENSPPGDS